MLAKRYHGQGMVTSRFLLELVDDMQMFHDSTSQSHEAVSRDVHAGQMDIGKQTLEIKLPIITQYNRNYDPSRFSEKGRCYIVSFNQMHRWE